MNFSRSRAVTPPVTRATGCTATRATTVVGAAMVVDPASVVARATVGGAAAVEGGAVTVVVAPLEADVEGDVGGAPIVEVPASGAGCVDAGRSLAVVSELGPSPATALPIPP